MYLLDTYLILAQYQERLKEAEQRRRFAGLPRSRQNPFRRLSLQRLRRLFSVTVPGLRPARQS